MVFEFEYEIRKGKLNLYERGRSRYLKKNRGGKIEGGISLANESLDVLFPVAHVRMGKSLEETILKALKQFEGLFYYPPGLTKTDYIVKDMESDKKFEGTISFKTLPH